MSGVARSEPRAAELRATYRLQLTSGFGFAGARALVPYLRDLGISHLYLSPCLQARPGSTHGYDVIDPRRLSEALGGLEEFRRLAGEVGDAGLGLVLDAVPNHMAADDANPFWADPALRERFFDLDPVSGRWRRFFDIDDLAGVRQEDPAVFEETHALLLGLVLDGLVDGLRVDHPDGLADPAGYLKRLRERGVDRVWVEKILSPGAGERLRDWPVCGTVGYEFLNDVCALFVDPGGEAPLTSLWSSVSADAGGFAEVALECKLEQLAGTFRPEVERLARVLDAPGLRDGLASLPVYRTYIDPVAGSVADEDRNALAPLDSALRRLLLLEDPAPPEFVTRFQQTTPAVMAKGVEDTAFYRYGRLIALNEVGGDPSRFGLGVDAFHAANLERAERFPQSLLTTQTHDAKRSADVRARIAVLSSMTEEWAQFVERFFALSEPLRVGGAPDDVERYFLLQTLVGAWPIERARMQEYMVKALREAKRNTSWVDERPEWEEAVTRFCGSLYEDRQSVAELERFVARLAPAGMRAALGQLVLKLTAPGIPDIYQGDELPFRALVDPDNRRPVDWRWRRSALDRLMGGAPAVAGTRKMFLTLRLLGLRARRPEAFAGSYEPLSAGA
ncbi:MAG: malto-oligosyltrehalose synthase, partial [Solirubrobacterales bacterium]|nr:malto-oligosyltrehalose synthase [Solirubrobacterales bacterium]